MPFLLCLCLLAPFVLNRLTWLVLSYFLSLGIFLFYSQSAIPASLSAFCLSPHFTLGFSFPLHLVRSSSFAIR